MGVDKVNKRKIYKPNLETEVFVRSVWILIWFAFVLPTCEVVYIEAIEESIDHGDKSNSLLHIFSSS